MHSKTTRSIKQSKDNLTSGEVLPVLVRFTLPIFFSILLQITYGTADLLIVGHFSDIANVSAVSIGSQVSQIFINLCIGLSLGTTILIGNHIGASNQEEAGKVVGASIFIFSIIAITFTLMIITFAHPLVFLMQAPVESFQQAKSYLIISGFGTIFLVMYNLLGSIFRGMGDSKTPLLIVAIACVLNILLDLLFVGALHMGAKGAAIATVIAQGASVALSLLFFQKKQLPFTFQLTAIRYDRAIIRKIFALGIPSALQMILSSLSLLVIAALMNSLGVAASAAVGIVGKILSIILIVPQAFSNSLSSFTAQNLGANQLDRTKSGLRVAIVISVLYGMIAGYSAFFHGHFYTRLFNPDDETTLAALSYLKAYGIDCVLVAFKFSYAGYFNGLGKTKFVMYIAIMSSLFIRIPVSYYFSTFENATLFLIGLAIPISSVCQIIASLLFMKLLKRNFISFQKF
ncbi:MAG: MATE family efflux transporter [Eubacteriales bacterium]